jgi:hypothetical protein
MRLADYVTTLERRYVELFPGFETTIRKAVRQSANAMAARYSGRKPSNGSSG